MLKHLDYIPVLHILVYAISVLVVRLTTLPNYVSIKIPTKLHIVTLVAGEMQLF